MQSHQFFNHQSSCQTDSFFIIICCHNTQHNQTLSINIHLCTSLCAFHIFFIRKQRKGKHIFTNQKKNTDAENHFEFILLVLNEKIQAKRWIKTSSYECMKVKEKKRRNPRDKNKSETPDGF